MVTLRIGMPIAQGERLPDSERLHAVELTKSTKIKKSRTTHFLPLIVVFPCPLLRSSVRFRKSELRSRI